MATWHRGKAKLSLRRQRELLVNMEKAAAGAHRKLSFRGKKAYSLPSRESKQLPNSQSTLANPLPGEENEYFNGFTGTVGVVASGKSSSIFSAFDGDSVIERYPFDARYSDPASHTTGNAHRYDDSAVERGLGGNHRRRHRKPCLKGAERRTRCFNRYAYSPYGQPKFYDGSWNSRTSSNYSIRILYAGYRWIQETGLYDVRHRMYNPSLGKWMQRDPLGYVDGMSLYQYCGSEPVGAVDPWGLKCNDCQKVLNALAGNAPAYPRNGRLAKAGKAIDTATEMAQAYMESNFDPSRVSPTGAVGLWQILPSTANDIQNRVFPHFVGGPIRGLPKGARLKNHLHNVGISTTAYEAYVRDRIASRGDNLEKGLERYIGSPSKKANQRYAHRILKGAKAIRRMSGCSRGDYECLMKYAKHHCKQIKRALDRIEHPRK